MDFTKLQRTATKLSQLELDTGNSISKQAIDGRLIPIAIGTNCLTMSELILKQALNLKYVEVKNELIRSKGLKEIVPLFNRILLQDSIVQSIPSNLYKSFPASYTKGKPAAMIRLLPIAIGTIFDLTNMCWLDFFIGSFCNNDQSQSLLIENVVQKNDLLLRDLGYFTLNSLELFIKEQFIITKWDNKSNLYYDENDENDEKINLIKLFKGKTKIDIPVQLGSKKRLKMRLIAKKLPKPQAKASPDSYRDAAAKKDRHSKTNHSKEYYKLLEWEIYLTNVPETKLSVEQIAKLYGLRWFIEILFHDTPHFDKP